VIPLGLERGDYHSLHSSFSSAFSDNDNDTSLDAGRGTDVILEADGSAWSTEEDRMLVELVLEKLKLTKSDWQDCARSLGKDRATVGRRWKSLMLNGDVGLKRGGLRRGRIHGTWR
jgi:transcriptional regulator with GAF, ATPase, and Fis domain